MHKRNEKPGPHFSGRQDSLEDTCPGNVLNCVQKVLEIEKGHGKKVCVDQNTDLHPLGGNHDPWQEV